MVTGGHNLGRVGTITHRERHPGGFDIVHIKDALGHTFATRYDYSIKCKNFTYYIATAVLFLF